MIDFLPQGLAVQNNALEVGEAADPDAIGALVAIGV
jgi:hypothetical protein